MSTPTLTDIPADKFSSPHPRPSARILWIAVGLGILALALLLAPSTWA